MISAVARISPMVASVKAYIPTVRIGDAVSEQANDIMVSPAKTYAPTLVPVPVYVMFKLPTSSKYPLTPKPVKSSDLQSSSDASVTSVSRGHSKTALSAIVTSEPPITSLFSLDNDKMALV